MTEAPQEERGNLRFVARYTLRLGTSTVISLPTQLCVPAAELDVGRLNEC
jgi:hypothetical protein